MRDPTTARWKTWIPGVAAVVAHALAMRDGFVLDDGTLLIGNPYVRTAAGLKTMLGSSLFAASRDPVRTDYYRPLASLLNWLSWQLFHDGQAGQHGLNIAMHAAVATLLAATLRRHGVRPGIALATATLFAVHPATAEIVAYIGGRQDMLGWLFVLGGLCFLPSADTLRAAILGATCMVLATFSREAFLAIVVLMPFAAAFRVDAGTFDRKKALATAGGVLAGFVVVAAARSAVGVRWSQPLEPHSATVWLGTGVALAARMLRDLVAPTDLAVDLTLDVPGLAASVLAIAGSLAILFLLFRALRGESRGRLGIALFGLLVAFATATVHTPVVLRYGYASDRYAYPFVVGAALLFAPLAQLATEALAPRLVASPLRKLLPAAPWAFAAVLVPATWARSTAWRSEESLQRQMYEDRPDDPQSKLAEGMRRLSIGDLAGALPLCEEYQVRFPTLTRADRCLAQCYLGLGKPQLAIAPLRRYTSEHLADEGARVAFVRAMFEANDVDGVERALDEWGPELAGQPDVIAARREIGRRRMPAPPP